MDKSQNVLNDSEWNLSSDFEKSLYALIRQLWALTSDFIPSDQDTFTRAKAWAKTVSPMIFDAYLNYTIKAILVSRQRKGPVHADEFLQVWLMVKSGQVWSTAKGEWTTLIDQICTIYEQSPVYELARRDFPEPTDAIQKKIKAQIYGWEE